ncbi:MAG TPA: iron-only hydrogenase system regulator [Spirochaetota bacterium]|nr:iron-only hydrogenase system regulator [Spirochaetota bacterium]HQE59097.1 iron-only hydrogenase system regulator [Spirochaetota bacterium]
MEKRIGAVAIVVTDNINISRLNSVLSEHADIIIGRMGIPRREKSLHIISLIVEGDTDQIGSLTGKIGRLPGIEVKSVLTKYKEDENDTIS